MPRIYTSVSDPLDFCADCFMGEEEAFELFGDLGDGPDGRGNCFGWDAGAPSYDDEGDDYRCHTCKRRLSDDVDG